MKKHHLSIIIIVFLFSTIINAQFVRETRAVWLTTNFKLDWPPNTFNEDEQKNSLRNIFENLNKKQFNTVYFQVRSNGSVLYKSNIDPSSHYLTGDNNIETSYDPLQYAIQLGKQYNIEVHAWINMIRCFSGSDESFLKNPRHVRNMNPNWTIRVMGENGSLSYWLNPGNYKVQDYLVDLMIELTGNYDIDGLHLDFFRYPGKNFNDDKFFNNYNLNISLEDWRRNNLTTILRKYKERAKPLNKYLKLGVTPIGIRQNLEGARGWQGYSSVYQDTEQWLKEGLVDYLTPQIYWDFKKNPKFDVLAKDWVKKSYGKNIILGLAAYKKDVQLELEKMIEYSKKIGAAGVSFFRYANISEASNSFFKKSAVPQNMKWKQKTSLIKNSIECTSKNISANEIILQWNDHLKNNTPIDFRNYIFQSANNIKALKLVSLKKNQLKLKFASPRNLGYAYKISKINRLWNITNTSNRVMVQVPFLNSLKKSASINSRPMIHEINKMAVLAVTSYTNQIITVEILSKENLKTQRIKNLKIGLNILPLDKDINIIKNINITFADNRKEELSLF